MEVFFRGKVAVCQYGIHPNSTGFASTLLELEGHVSRMSGIHGI